MSPYCLFCSTNCAKSKEIQFIVTGDEEKHQIIRSEKLETANFGIFALKMNNNKKSKLFQIIILSID